MSTLALARPAPVRSNRVRDLVFVAASFVAFAAVLQIWHFGARQLLGTTEMAELVVAVLFPISTLPMYTRLALGPGPMLVQTLALAALVQAIPTRVPWLGLQVLVGGVVGASLVGDPRGRGSVVTAGTAAGLASAAVFLFLSGSALGTPQLVAGSMSAIVGGALSGGLLLAISPLIERLFGHVTPLTLLEALSYDHPLLRRLITQAPGTFLHSTNLAILSDVAARRIGANALVARVGALYHDVGKTFSPENFIENQQGEIREDRRSIEEIARCLVQHVSDGAALIRSYGLGDTIAQFALEHHGTSPMRSLLARLDNDSQLNSRNLQYPGPRPRSKETGIVMIGDQLEAKARVFLPQTRDECIALVRDTVARITADQQLVYAGLTEEDLEQMEAAFADVLHAIHHRRLGYALSDDVTPSAMAIRDTVHSTPLQTTDA
jgi:putative nucleotidyltransferase with HDIG domain